MSVDGKQVALHALYARGRDTWPAIALDLATFSALAECRLGDGPLDDVRADELYLAIACVTGNEQAIAALDKHYLSGLVAMLIDQGQDSATADDVVQAVRVHFLVSEAGAAPRIAAYNGRGSLAGWFRVAAVRTAISAYRKHRREVVADEVECVAAAPCPELALFRQEFGVEFRPAFQAAFEALTPRERNLLRYHIIDGLGIDRIAALYGVHRATAARWLAHARAALLDGVRCALQDKLRIGAAELDSLFRQLLNLSELSLRLFLTPAPPPATSDAGTNSGPCVDAKRV